MKRDCKHSLLKSLVLLLLTGPALGEKDQDCGFGKYKPRHITHFAEKAAVLRVEPEYPEDAQRKGVSGEVMIRVLIPGTRAGSARGLRRDRTTPALSGLQFPGFSVLRFFGSPITSQPPYHIFP